MTPARSGRLALASLAPLAALAAIPAFAQDDARVPGNRYVVVNQTGGALACRYRVNEGGSGGIEMTAWRDYPAISAGAEFSRTAQGPGESVSLACSADSERASAFTVRPGQRYRADKGDNGKVAITRQRG